MDPAAVCLVGEDGPGSAAPVQLAYRVWVVAAQSIPTKYKCRAGRLTTVDPGRHSTVPTTEAS
ncbi:hypothetical protein GCM10023175_36880 [Pseudonocardia xishanensis]|uniref:Uncharacterized protein n=1 Tax=Pseudonocardia xishanensis TaxID=630995 RepID=A0ABP8RU03_9PSEU